MANTHIEHRRTINVFILAMLSMSAVISLRNLPLTSTYGLSALFFYIAAAIFFMIPYALVSAELASGWPKGGGVFIWIKEGLGERWGFFAIWMQWFHNMTWYPALLAFVGSGIAYIFDPDLATNKTYLTWVILIGFWGVTFLNFLGIKTSAWVSTLCLIIGTMIPGILLIAFALTWFFQGNPLQISFSASHVFPDLHLSNLIFLSGIFLALSGLELNANLAREVKNPQKNYPRAIFIGVFFTLAILILGSLSIAMVIPKTEISLIAGLLEAFTAFLHLFHLTWLIPVMAIFIVLGALGELNAWAMAGVKGLFVTTEHGALPPFFHKLNRNHVPTRLLIFQAIIVSVAALVFISLPNVNLAFWVLNATSAQMYILMYILLFLAAITLRYTKPNVHRPYKIPYKNAGIWIVVILGLFASIFALFFSFFAPKEYQIVNIVTYGFIMLLSLAISCAIPLIIYALRKPHWKLEVLPEIREEIHKSVH